MDRIGIFVATLIVLAMLASTMVFSVDERKIAVVYTFGKVEQIINAPATDGNGNDADGKNGRAGLHFKWPPPFQTVGFIDRRIQTLDNANPKEVFVGDDQMGLVVDWFIKWRVIDATAFIRANGGIDVKTAEEKLGANVRGTFDTEVASRSGVQAVLDSDRQAIMRAVIDNLKPDAAEMGIAIVDVRMRRVDYSASTAPKIFEQMRTERRSYAEKLKAEGAAQKESIRADADRQYQIEVANAYDKAQQLMGDGDAEAVRLFGVAFGKDPEFADFYRSLQAYRGSFSENKDMLVLSPESDFFKFMQSGKMGRQK